MALSGKQFAVKNMLFCVGLALLLAGCASVGTSPANGYGNLNSVDIAAGGGEYGYLAVETVFAENNMTANEMAGALVYLRGKSLQASYDNKTGNSLSDPRFHILYGTQLKKMLDTSGAAGEARDSAMETAVAVFYAGAVLVEQDILRCDDRGVGLGLMMQIQQHEKHMQDSALSLSMKQRRNAKFVYDQLLENAAQRAPARYACKSGAGYYAKMESAAYASKVKRTEIKTSGGTRVLLDDREANIPINFVSDNIWKPKAEAVRERYNFVFLN